MQRSVLSTVVPQAACEAVLPASESAKILYLNLDWLSRSYRR
jgi:hypothetical protein